LLGPPNYFQIFTNNEHDDAIREISLQIENLIEELSNSKDNILLNMLNKYPYLSVKAPVRQPLAESDFRNHRSGRTAGVAQHLAVSGETGQRSESDTQDERRIGKPYTN
jgi:hypothetical protein